MANTIRLAEGTNWAELLPLGGGVAKVVGGNVHQKGDLVSAPGTMGWDEAAAPGATPGDTALSPFDVELRYDSVTDACITLVGVDDGRVEDLQAHPTVDGDAHPAEKLLAATDEEDEALRTLRATEVTSVDLEPPDDTPAKPDGEAAKDIAPKKRVA